MDGEWHHVAVNSGAKQQVLYVDGKAQVGNAVVRIILSLRHSSSRRVWKPLLDSGEVRGEEGGVTVIILNFF